MKFQNHLTVLSLIQNLKINMYGYKINILYNPELVVYECISQREPMFVQLTVGRTEQEE